MKDHEQIVQYANNSQKESDCTSSCSGTLAWNYFVVLWLLVITFPAEFSALKPGLDPSWCYAVNYVTQTHFMFGQDVVHTMGPLGYLIHPFNIGSNLIHATILRIVIHTIFGACLLYYAHKTKSVLPLTLFAIGYTISMVIVICLPYTYHLLLVLSLLICIGLDDAKVWWIATPIAAVLGAAMLLMKPGLGIAAFTIVVTATVRWVLSTPRKAGKIILVSLGAYLLSACLLAAACMGSIPNWLTWLKGSLYISDGFTVATSTLGPRRFLLCGVAAFAVYCALAFVCWRQRSMLRHITVILLAAIFLAFKHGFVRADGHARNYFPFLLASISIMALIAVSKSDLRRVAIAYVLVAALSLPVGAYYNRDSRLPPASATILGRAGWLNIVSTVFLTETRSRLDRETTANLTTKRLPEEWVRTMKQRNLTVDVIPWELSYLVGNGLTWRPNPTVQLFMSYTRALDQWSAKVYGSPDGPDALIVEFQAIDERNLLLDTPAAVQSILAAYEIDREMLSDNLLLLKRKGVLTKQDFTNCGEQAILFDEWVKVPLMSNVLFAELDMTLSPLGHITKLLFRIPPVYFDVVYESGRKAKYRITPENCKHGLLCNYLPTDQLELYNLLKGTAKDRILQFRVTGLGTSYYSPKVPLKWERANHLPILEQ
jgi:hypothetical protein